MLTPDPNNPVDAKWQANPIELDRLYSLSPGQRAEFAKRIDELEAEQDAIEWDAGGDDVLPGSVRYSGMS